MGLRGKEVKDQKNKVEVPNEETTSEKKETVKTTEVTIPKASTPAVSKGPTSLNIQNEGIVNALAAMDAQTLPLIYAKDGTHNVAGDEFGKEFTYFPVLQEVYWKLDTCVQDDEDAYEFNKFSNDVDAKIDKDRLDKDGVSLGDSLQVAIDAGYAKSKIKRYVAIKCLIMEHEEVFDLTSSNNFAIFRIAPGSQWGKEGFETMIKGLALTAAMGNLQSTDVPGLDEQAVLFKAAAKNTKYKSGPSYTMSVVTPA